MGWLGGSRCSVGGLPISEPRHSRIIGALPLQQYRPWHLPSDDLEGRTTDGNGQFAKIWVGDFNGSNEPGEPGEHEGKNTTDFAAGSYTTSVTIAEGEYLWYRHLEDGSGGISGLILQNTELGPTPLDGVEVVAGVRANHVFSEPTGDPVPGLGQSWYAVGNPASKAGVDDVIANNSRIVPYFQAEGSTWWSGSNDVEIENVPAYPAQIADVDPFPLAGNPSNADEYTVQLIGQIKFEESGTYRFLDGIDDYTYFAVDTDRSGVAGDADGEVLIDDNGWTNALSTANGGAPIVEVDIDLTAEEIAAGGAWLEMEFMAAEGGGGDSGILYWDFHDENGLFPVAKGDGVFDEIDAGALIVPDTHLRSPVTGREIIAGDFAGQVPSSPTGWLIDVDPANGTAEGFTLENPDDSIYKTVMNLEGAEFHINALGEVTNGQSFQIVFADEVTGEPTIATEGWSFDPATGSVVFGTLPPGCNPNTQGDIDGNGTVEFADFLVLSGNFGSTFDPADHTKGDLDCNGTVEFADFLVLSGNFGNTVGGAESVPEPTAWCTLLISMMCMSLVRRRR